MYFFSQITPAYANTYPGDYYGDLTTPNVTVQGNVTGTVYGYGDIVQGDVLKDLEGRNNIIWGNVKGNLDGSNNEVRKNVYAIGAGRDNTVWGNIEKDLSGASNTICNNVFGNIPGRDNVIWGSSSGINSGTGNSIKNMGGGLGPCTSTSPPTQPTATPIPPTPTPIPPTATPTSAPTPTNAQPNYTISGSIFNDANKNGIRDIGEANYSGTPGISASRGTVATNADGSYTISNLSAGLVTISYMSLPQGFNMTSPHNGPPPSFQVTVGPGCDTNTANGALCQ